ncbi:type VI secretion system Vgr family protein [Klebsiella pneumoniae]
MRAQKGIFISADGQAQAQGQVLAMEPAVSLLERCGESGHGMGKHYANPS